MGRGETIAKNQAQPEAALLAVAESSVDPTLASLFAGSSGPVTAPVRIVRSDGLNRETDKNKSKKDISTGEAEAGIEGDEEDKISSRSASEDGADLGGEQGQEEPDSRPRKRRRLSQDDDLEAAYLNRLAQEEQKENSKAKAKAKGNGTKSMQDDVEDSDDDTASSTSNDLEDLSDAENDNAIPQHEYISNKSADYEKTRRTVFLGNVSTQAIKSKTAKKEFETHLKSALDPAANESIESIRFRSTAYNVTAGPKKAAYAKKDLMDDTTKSTNAYVVFTTEAAARKVARTLNGTTILDRHLHTDWLAHPTATDHKRCVFVGNLNFVDLESNTTTTATGDKTPSRPKAKEPADAEEGLWRAFIKCGSVESVRVIRDPVTRVGKGFAYVQFSDEVAAEKALALDGKKFPPMLPRVLRVSRAKRVLKKDLKRKRDEKEVPGKGARGASRRPAGKDGAAPAPRKAGLNGVVFEGYRASSDRGMKFKTKGRKKASVKPTSRSSKRGAAFKAGGGKKKRDMK